MKFVILIVTVIAYVCIGAIICGAIDKYQSTYGNGDDSLSVLAVLFWPTLIIITILYYPGHWCFKIGQSLIKDKKDEDDKQE